MQEGIVAPSDPPREVSFWLLFTAICVVLFVRKFLKSYVAKHAAEGAPDLRGSKFH